jgi:hypothetical protein
MLSRALSLATVMLLIGCFASNQAQAQNLEAGKSPSQIFAGTCTACHKSPRGLLRTVPAGSLTGFLREHYTTSSDMAALLSAFLVSNGAADPRYVGKPDRDAKPVARPTTGPGEPVDRQGRRLRTGAPSPEAARPGAGPQQAAKPDADGLSPQAQPGHPGRNAKRLARPGEAPEVGKPVEGEAPAQAATERGPDGRKSAAKQRLSKRGKPGTEELPRTDAVTDEPAKGETPKEDKPASETDKDAGGKPSGEAKSEAARGDAPKETGSGETPALRADPVPPVTPAPAAAPPASAAVSGVTPERPHASSAPAAAEPAAAPAVSAPPAPPAAPSGPAIAPISQ